MIIYKIRFQTYYGAPTHYFHFFLSCLVPLILHYINNEKKNGNCSCSYIIVSDVGPMLKILLSLPIPIKYEPHSYEKTNVQEILLPRYDSYTTLNPILDNMKKNKLTNKQRKCVIRWFKDIVNRFDMFVKALQKYDIIFIERKVDLSYKLMGKTKDIPITCGAQRRSISNHKDILQLLTKLYPNYTTLSIALEFIPISEQYYLFRNCKVLIAQHGAALVNMFFMKKHSTVIEIIDVGKMKEDNSFQEMAKAYKLHYFRYMTKNPHTTIDIKNFTNFLTTILF